MDSSRSEAESTDWTVSAEHSRPTKRKSRLSRRGSKHVCFSDISRHAEGSSPTEVDLKSLNRKCLLDVVQVLNKCYCIWHRPTREAKQYNERQQAYQLMLLKLKEHMPYATIEDIRSVVRQLVRNYFKVTENPRVDGGVTDGKNEGDGNYSTSREVAGKKSKAVQEKLCFLNGIDATNVNEFINDRYCDFCNAHIPYAEEMWTHMIKEHLPIPHCSTTRFSPIRPSSITTSVSTALTAHEMSDDTLRHAETTSDTATTSNHTLRHSRRKTALCRKSKIRVTSQARRRRQRRKLQKPKKTVLRKIKQAALEEYSDEFLTKFIDLLKQQECLWLKSSKAFRNKKLRADAYDTLAREYCRLRNIPTVNISKIKGIIRRLRRYYGQLNSERNENMDRRHIWAQMKFLEDHTSNGGPYTPRREKEKAEEDYKCGIKQAAMEEYSDEFLTKFIDLLKQQECLWLKSSKAFRNKKLRADAYDTLTREYCRLRNIPTVNISTIKGIIRRLRHYYGQLNSERNENIDRRHIWAQMKFLEDHTSNGGPFTPRREKEKPEEDYKCGIKQAAMGEYSDEFLTKFIDLLKQQECLWLKSSKAFRNKKLRADAYDTLVREYCRLRNVPTVNISKIKGIIRRLRHYYGQLNSETNKNMNRRHIWSQMKFLEDHTSNGGPYTPRREKEKAEEEYKCGIKHSGLEEYSDEFLTKFIDLLKQQECLWLKSSKAFRNKKLRADAYDTLAREYCRLRNIPTVNISKIKGIIRRLRHYYGQLNCETQENMDRKHIWAQMKFLEDHTSNAGPYTTRREIEKAEEDYKCGVCAQTYKRQKSLSQHVLKVHPQTDCNKCNEKFGNADELRRHTLSKHRKERDCPLCTKSEPNLNWNTNEHLKEHFYEHCCRRCSETFHDVENFRRHKSKCRLKGRFLCDDCDKRFSRPMDFRQHCRKVHRNSRAFKCSDCNQAFQFLAKLIEHRRMHP